MQTTLSMPNSGLSVAGSASNTSMPAPATLPLFSAAIRSASTTSPPRAQLMMRTPSFILAIDCRVDDVAGLVGQRRVQRDEVGARQQFVELDLLDAELGRPLLRQERVERDDVHLEADAARGDDRADIAAADDAERLAGDLDAHEAVLLPLAGMGRLRWPPASARASANISAMACSAVVIELPNGVFMTMMPRRDAAGMSTLSTPMPARPITFSAARRIDQLLGDLGGRADGQAVILVDDGQQARPCPCRGRAGSRPRRRDP